MAAEPFSGVTMPLDVEAIAVDPIEAGERSVELFAEILGEAGSVALNQAIFGAVPFSQDIDRIVELRRPELWAGIEASGSRRSGAGRRPSQPIYLPLTDRLLSCALLAHAAWT
jgi:hypothetical protein